MGAFKKISSILICAVCVLCTLGTSIFADYTDTYGLFSWWYEKYTVSPHTWQNAYTLQHYVDGTVRRATFKYTDLADYSLWLNLGYSSSSASVVPINFESNVVYYFVFTLGLQNKKVVSNPVTYDDWKFIFDDESVFIINDINNNAFANSNKTSFNDIIATGDYLPESNFRITTQSTTTVDGLRYISFGVYFLFDNLPVNCNGVALRFNGHNVYLDSSLYSNSEFQLYVSQLRAYYDDSGVLPDDNEDINSDVDDIVAGQLAAAQAQLDAEEQANQDAYNDSSTDGMMEASSTFGMNSYQSAFSSLLSAINYTGTDFSFKFPQLNIPFFDQPLSQEQIIPFKTYIDALPSGVLSIIRFLGWLGIIFSIIHLIRGLVRDIGGGGS